MRIAIYSVTLYIAIRRIRHYGKASAMGEVTNARSAGSIVRRVREDQGISRATLAKRTGIGARTIYAFEQGESENFGLGNYLKLLGALGLSMSVDFPESGAQSVREPASSSLPIPEFGLADIWKLDGDAE